MRKNILLFFLMVSNLIVCQNKGNTGYADGNDPTEKTAQVKSKFVKIYQANSKFGFEDYQNNKQEAIYDNITYGLFGFIVQKDNKFGIANEEGTLKSKIIYDHIETFKSFYKVKKNKKFGLLSNTGEIVLPILYSEILISNKLAASVKDKKGNKKMVVIDAKISLPKNTEIVTAYQNLLIAKQNGKFGVISESFNSPFVYDSLYVEHKPQQSNYNQPSTLKVSETFVNDLFTVKNKKIGLLSNTGEILYEPDNDNIERIKQKHHYLIKKNNLYSIYFTKTNVKTNFEYQSVYAEGSEHIMAVKDNKTGVFNTEGKLIIPFIYDSNSIRLLSNNNFSFTKDRKKGMIDKNGTVIIPAMYDNYNFMYQSNFKDYIQVENNGKQGVIHLNGEIVIPIEYDFVDAENDMFKVGMRNPNRVGICNKKGEVIVPLNYHWIAKSNTRNSTLFILDSSDKTFNFFSPENNILFSENVSEYGCVPNEERLNNNDSYSNIHLLYFKDKNGKYGLINEVTGKIVAPAMYDNIIQQFDDTKNVFFAVQKEKKYGLINEKNEIIIPIVYEDINLDFVFNYYDSIGDNIQLIVAKNGKYGTVNLKNEVKIPFEYKVLKRVSPSGIFKAIKKDKYQLIDFNNQPVVSKSFDEVSNFERVTNDQNQIIYYQALTFDKGKMQAIDQKGNILTPEEKGQMHVGYATFDELKKAFIEALEHPKDVLLKEFVEKIAPSEHLLYFLKYNIFKKTELLYVNIPYIKEQYLNVLIDYKYNYWNNTNQGLTYYKAELTDTVDYTGYTQFGVTNKRRDNSNYTSKILGDFLRNAIKINGFWISSNFMKGNY
ncbi:MAG TPA: WG repeat-containing protein [Flavobacterium sp.]|uniref:WG repeat-containing protein n=2 Tax=Flavobacterium TaxID=237 RepID=UPI0025BB13BE|nr:MULTISPECIES: WG repeat-containing protein [unclassified Flavobacterium]HRE78291.1 WG repeat-containing protein [Flavobacterium sp.]